MEKSLKKIDDSKIWTCDLHTLRRHCKFFTQITLSKIIFSTHLKNFTLTLYKNCQKHCVKMTIYEFYFEFISGSVEVTKIFGLKRCWTETLIYIVKPSKSFFFHPIKYLKKHYSPNCLNVWPECVPPHNAHWWQMQHLQVQQ